MPRTRTPWLRASIVADAMTPLIPGAGPPPTRIASVSSGFMTCRSHGRGRGDGSHALAELRVERVEELIRRQPRLIGSDQDREVLRHLPGLDRIDAHALECLGKSGDLRRLIDLAAMRQPARPREDRGDRIRRRL